jgi:hypothetical protein
MWEIYSIGDAAFLERVLNALAMLAGTGNLEQVAAIGMLVGLIILGFQSIFQGGTGIRFQNILVAWILYGIMFGSSARVAIEDVYSGQVRVVDNVPYGVAAAGSMVSQLGYGVTSLFEQAFGEAQMTAHGFAFALETLSNLRKMSLSKSSLGKANSPQAGDDFWQSWRNYIADCTMTGVNNGQYSEEDIRKAMRSVAGGVLDQLRFDSQAYGTQLVLSGIGSQYQSCTDAFVILSEKTRSTFLPALERKASEVFGVAGSTEASSRIQDAFMAIEQSQIDAQNYMLATAMAPIFDWALVDNEVNFQRVASASMLHTAIQQRNEAWAAEQALFNTVVRPMMTFFEGLVYAVTPMMAFLIGLGPMGVTLMGKYLMILLWIQLWMPVLSIINLYLHMAVAKKMVALQAPAQGDLSLESFYGIYSLDQTLQTWIATGGMLASSVPAITLMLIYGGAVTASSVASRMSSGHMPADISTPAMASNSPLLERGSMATSNDMHGLSATGAEALKFQVSGNYSNALGSSSEEVSTKQAAFAQQFGQQIMQSYGSAEQGIKAISAGIGQTSQDSETYRAAVAYGHDLTKNMSFAEQLTDNQKAMIGAGTSFGIGAGVGGSAGGVKADAKVGGQVLTQIANEAGLTDSQRQELAEKLNTNIGNSRETGASLVNAVAKESRDTSQNTFTKNVGLTDNEAVNRSASELLSSSERFTANNQLQRSMGIVSSHSNETLPSELRRRGLDDDVRQFVQNYGSEGGQNSLHNMVNGYYDAIMGKNPHTRPEDAKLAAQAFAIADGRFLEDADPALRQQMALEGSRIFSGLAGMPTPDQTAYSSNKGVGGDVNELTTGVREKAEGQATGPSVNAGQVKSGVDAGLAQTNENIRNVSPDVSFGDAQKKVDEARDDHRGEFGNERSNMLNERVQAASKMNNNVIERLGAVHGITGNFSPQTLRDEGTGHMFFGSSNLDAMMDEAQLPTGMDRSEFMAMDEHERQAVAAQTHAALSQGLQKRGLHEDVANYAASMMLPEAMTQMYSGGGGLSGLVGLTPSYSEEDMRHAAHVAGTEQRHQSHDKLHNGLMEATGDSGVAAMAMQDMAKASVVMMNLGTAEASNIGSEMIDRTMNAVGYGGENSWSPGGGGPESMPAEGPASVPAEGQAWYESGGKAPAPAGDTQAQSDYMNQAPKAQTPDKDNPNPFIR